ncbi:hypothetical protein KIH39_26350 [Telmatocola sphagniphila]|uniref:Uncharacterized protein n=1 Tax=Telmatocola sphagniphila TaxID=1123043 RepID=A0A8E6B5W4_9BACT|nr:hypothetical protein [Telmatocola sphagniphila]QVL32311.1 hypothetical protein KIH39_26350 [Telmatocola sphagniphila]
MPSKICVRACLLWCARWLVRRPSGKPTGRIRVEITDLATGASVRICGEADSRMPSPWTETISPLPGGHIVAAFSEEDELILKAIRDAGVLPLKQLIIAMRSNMGATLCKFHVKNLRKRNAVQLTPDGYTIATDVP